MDILQPVVKGNELEHPKRRGRESRNGILGNNLF